MPALTISQVARQTGLRPSALRYYESIGLLPPAERISGQRRYDEGVFQRLAIIQTAQQAGFSLDELRILFDQILSGSAPSSEWHTLIQRKLHELETLLNNVQRMKRLLQDIMDCDDDTLAECIYLTGERHRERG
jgi:MerR family transcriptional regulator, redox-sensitive transcriptional activator SoxR